MYADVSEASNCGKISLINGYREDGNFVTLFQFIAQTTTRIRVTFCDSEEVLLKQ